MSADLERAIRSYAEYLDETLPTVTAEEAMGATDPTAVVRPRAVRPHLPWYRRPTVVFVAAMAAVLLIALVPVLLRSRGQTDVVETPATTAPPPEAATTTTPPPTEASDSSTFTLVPSPGTEPVVVSTTIGDFEFVTLQYPPNVSFALPYNVEGTVHGPVAVDDQTLWWSTDYETWHRTPIGVDSGFPTIVGEEVVVPGETGAIRFLWDGDGWVQRASIELPIRPNQIVFGPQGSVAVSGDTTYFSEDGVSFTEASRGPDLSVFWAATDVPEEDRDFGDCRATFGATAAHIGTVLATDAGFVAVTAAEHPIEFVCAPLLWFSPDGDIWDLVAAESPFGERSIVDVEPLQRPIATADGRFVATGETGGMGIDDPEDTIWVSDDAVSWTLVPVDGLGSVISINAGELGWVLVDSTESDGVRMWTSTDAVAWDGPHQPPGGLTVGYATPPPAVTADAIVAVNLNEEIVVVGRLKHADGG